MERIVSILLITCMCFGLFVGCGEKENDSKEKKEKKPEPEYNLKECEFKGIKFSDLELTSDENEIVLKGTLTNNNSEEKSVCFNYYIYNEKGEYCPFISTGKFSTSNYKIKAGESLAFEDRTVNEDNSKGPYTKYTISGIYDANAEKQTISSDGITEGVTQDNTDKNNQSEEHQRQMERASYFSQKGTDINNKLKEMKEYTKYSDIIESWFASPSEIGNSCNVDIKFNDAADIRVGTVSAIRNEICDVVLAEMPDISEVTVEFDGIGSYVFSVGDGWDREVSASDKE